MTLPPVPRFHAATVSVPARAPRDGKLDDGSQERTPRHLSTSPLTGAFDWVHGPSIIRSA